MRFLVPDAADPAFVVLVLSLCFLLFTYVGYPAWVVGRSKLFARRPLPVNLMWPRVTCVVLAHNEGAALLRKVKNLLALDYPKELLDIIVADDGSTDSSPMRAQRLSPARVSVVSQPSRGGKAAAIVSAAKQATADVLVFCDARQLIDPGAIRALVRPLMGSGVGAVSGRLVLDTGRGAGAYWRYESAIRRAEAKMGSAVGVTGALYAIKRELFPLELPPQTVLDDVYVPMKLLLRGYRVDYAEDAVARDTVFDVEREFERKVRTLGGNCQLIALLPELLLPWRNPVFVQFLWHKLARLVCPFMLLALFGCSLIAPGFFASTLLVLQVGACGLAVSGLLRGARGGRLEALCCAFVVLNVAAVVGIYRFTRGGAQGAWAPTRAHLQQPARPRPAVSPIRH